ncbi:phage tail tape measure protein [Streptomyces niveus]|uniref:phage tail tape measure protein n=1 Tax=Streptomyces niveus TaxID=193462 RepID=UPI0035D69325
MAQEVGVAFVRLVPSMRGFGPEAARAMNDATTGPAGDAGDAAGGRFSGAFSTAMAAGGLLAGAALVGGIGAALDQGKITAKLGAQLGATPAEAERYGKVAGQLYAKGVTTDFQAAADAIKATMSAGLAPPGATNAQLESIATKVSDVATTFDLDLGQSANAVGQMMKTKLAPDAKGALDVIARGMQVMGPRADDLADTFNEYSVQFKNMGLSAEMATGILAQGMKAGARDTDLVADTIKEFSIEAVAGGERVKTGFSSLGLNADEMVEKFAAGGPAAASAFDTVLDKLRAIEDPAKRNTVAIELFGTKAEDMGQSLYALDPSKAVAGLGQVAGASGKLGDSLRDNAGAQLTAFTRGIQQGFVEILGGQVIPAMMSFGQWAGDNATTMTVLASVIGGVLITALTFMAITATQSAIANTAAWFTTGTTAGASAARQVVAAGRVVGGWVLMGLQSMVQAARMAAAWVIAMGPVGWIIATVIALAALIWANWDKIKKATGVVWDWIWSKIKGTGSTILGYIKSIPLVSLFLNHWDKIKSGTVNKVLDFISYVREIPGRIKSAFGSLGSLLYNQGRNVVQGLWNGIKGMGGWLRGQLISFAKSQIPGPIAKALGISSPSKLMADEIGHWIPAGIGMGVEANLGAVTDATQYAAAAVLPPAIGQAFHGAAASTSPTVVIDGTAMPRALLEWLRGAVRTEGQGSAQVLLGQPGR